MLQPARSSFQQPSRLPQGPKHLALTLELSGIYPRALEAAPDGLAHCPTDPTLAAHQARQLALGARIQPKAKEAP